MLATTMRLAMVQCMLGFLFATITVALHCTSNSIHDEATATIASTWRRLANVTSSKREEDDKSDFTLVVMVIAVSIIGSLVCASRKQQPLQTRVEIASRMGGQYNYGQRLKEGGGREPTCSVCGETYPRTSMHCTGDLFSISEAIEEGDVEGEDAL